MDELNKIFKADLPDIEKLAQAFGWITNQHIEHGQREIELLKAEQDRQAVIKAQVNLETIKYMRRVFDDCYRQVTGKKAWDE